MWPTQHGTVQPPDPVEGYGVAGASASSSTGSQQQLAGGRYSLDSGVSFSGYNSSFLSNHNDSVLSASDVGDGSFGYEADVSAFNTRYGLRERPVDASPPSKWGRVKTPPNRRSLDSAVGSANPPSSSTSSSTSRRRKSAGAASRDFDENTQRSPIELDLSIYSPPLRNMRDNQPSSSAFLRTPTTTSTGLPDVLTTPSPLNLRRKKFSEFSPPIYVRTGKLSLRNSENARRYRVTQGRLVECDANQANVQPSSSRCLIPPEGSTSRRREEPAIFSETPSKCFDLHDPFEGFAALPPTTPLKGLFDDDFASGSFFTANDNDVENDFKIVHEEKKERRKPQVREPPKKNRTSLGDLMFCGGRRIQLERRKKDENVKEKPDVVVASAAAAALVETTANIAYLNSSGPLIPGNLEDVAGADDKTVDKPKKVGQQKGKNGRKKGKFRTPKKPPNLYSARWMQIATGDTDVQSELTASAFARAKSRGDEVTTRMADGVEQSTLTWVPPLLARIVERHLERRTPTLPNILRRSRRRRRQNGAERRAKDRAIVPIPI